MLIPGDDGESETAPSVAHPRRHSGHLLHSSSQLPQMNQSMGGFRKRNEVPGADTRNCAGLLEVRREAERLVSLGARLQLLKGSAARAESPR